MSYEKPPILPVGTHVRSYDFMHDKTCYIEGVIEGYGGDVFPSDSHYRIRTTKRVWEGHEVVRPEQENLVYPPMHGMFGRQLVFPL